MMKSVAKTNFFQYVNLFTLQQIKKPREMPEWPPKAVATACTALGASHTPASLSPLQDNIPLLNFMSYTPYHFPCHSLNDLSLTSWSSH